MIEAIEKKQVTLVVVVAASVLSLVVGFAFGWALKPEPEAALLRLAADQRPIYPENAAEPTIDAKVAAVQDVARVADVSVTVEQNLPRWQQHAKPVALKEGYSYVAIVLDDLGVVPSRSRMAIDDLPAEITLAFLPYGKATDALAPYAYNQGHEIMLHLPMEPTRHDNGYLADPGPDALLLAHSDAEIRARTQKNIDALKDYTVGANNHMGSAFTAWQQGMAPVLELIADAEMFFLDSLTSPESVVKAAAANYDLPVLTRHVFIDHVQEEAEILRYLSKTVAFAKRRGRAIAIGHPHAETLAALKQWIPTLDAQKIQLVPITAMIEEKSHD